MADKKNAAERFAELLDLHNKGAITVKQFEEKRSKLLVEPVSDASNDTTELAQWFKLRELGAISQDEYDARVELVMNPKSNTAQPNTQPNQNTAQPPAPKKKKSLLKKVFWGLAIVAAIAGVGRSCSSGKGKSGPVKQPDYSATQVVDFSKQLKAEVQKALEGKEDWRAEFDKKMDQRGFDAKTKAFFHHGISEMSCYSVMMKLPQTAEYAKDYNKLIAKRQEVLASMPKKYVGIYNATLGKEKLSWNHKIENEGVKDVPMSQVCDNVLDRFEAHVQALKNAQRMQQGAVK